jgi:hypothetical protein
MTQLNANQPTESTTIDTRYNNFYDAYRELGYNDPSAQYSAQERLREDDAALFNVYGCTNFTTAKASIWLMEAVTMLCAGDLHNADAVWVIEKALKSIKEQR